MNVNLTFEGLSTTFEASMNVLQHKFTYFCHEYLLIHALKLPVNVFLY